MTLASTWLDEGLIIDNFAGGGGASTGIEMALGRSPDVAINHDAEAVALHAANHPDTLHLCQNVWKADPRWVVRQASARRCALLGIPARDLPVRFAWFSPDCKHFSKAKGSKPVEKGIRDLAWVVVHWARLVQPEIIALENVEEFKDWGPLVATDDGKLVPCPKSKGFTFKRWVRELKRAGYKRVEHRELRAFQYGAPTMRKRLFVIATRSGAPIRWPEPTHGKPDADGTVPGGLLPWHTAAECIDWSLVCPSIFERERPLAENTLKRVARGVMRYVVNAERPYIVGTFQRAAGAAAERSAGSPPGAEKTKVPQPFIVGVGGRMGQSPERPVDVPAQTLTAKADSAVVQPVIVSTAHGGTTGRAPYAWPAAEPLRTAKASQEYAVVEPFVAGIDNSSNGDRDAWPGGEPVRTITSENRFALVAPLTHHGGERGQPVDEPARTITGAHRGEQALIEVHAVAPHVTKFRANSDGHRADEPLHTITANSFVKRPGGAAPLGLVSAVLVPRYGEREEQAPRALPVTEPMPTVVPTQNGASLVAASLATYYGPKPGEKGRGAAVDTPLRTQTTENRHALVAGFLAQHNTGNDGHDAREPVSTIVGKGCTQGVVEAKAAILSHAYTSNTAGGNGDPGQPAKTITTGGHHALVECDLFAADRAGAERVAAFIAKYYGAAEHGQPLDEPLHTTTAKPRFALVTVNGWPIVDIGLRMLQPRELYRAQGFPPGYVIDGPAPNGKPMTKTAQVRMCGNSVCPPIAQAIARAVVFGREAAPLAGVAD